MAFFPALSVLVMTLVTLSLGACANSAVAQAAADACPIAPKIFILSMFTKEAGVWYGIPDFNLLEQNITVLGLSPLFPDVHCTNDHSVCQLTTGEGEINAATTITSLVYSPLFNLSQTYFMIAGIAGINPNEGTTADVVFSRYAVQVTLQQEFDAREKPDNFTTGYFPQNSDSPTQYPQEFYGTEVFELNQALQQVAVAAAKTATLNDTSAAAAYRANFAVGTAARSAPSVRQCDVATSDNYFSGELLGDAFGNYTKLVTNGTGVYCVTAQEDNATLEAMLRGAISHRVDFARIILMRTASDFDRPYPGQSPLQNLVYDDPEGSHPAEKNIYLAGIKVIDTVLTGWDTKFEQGIAPSNYVGDVFGTLGGTPDFGNVSPISAGIKARTAGKSMGRMMKRG